MKGEGRLRRGERGGRRGEESVESLSMAGEHLCRSVQARLHTHVLTHTHVHIRAHAPAHTHVHRQQREWLISLYPVLFQLLSNHSNNKPLAPWPEERWMMGDLEQAGEECRGSRLQLAGV